MTLTLERMSDERRAALRGLAAAGAIGSPSLPGVMNSGHLATFVHYGLAERWEVVDRIGAHFRYRITPAGLGALEPAGPARGPHFDGVSLGRRHQAGVMAARDMSADERDFFPTWPWAARAGAELVRRLDPAARSVWEPACGMGSMVHGLRDVFTVVHASDAYQYGGNVVWDFVAGADADAPYVADWIITNPPFAPSLEFIRLAHRRARRGSAMLLPTRYLSGQDRDRLFWDETGHTAFAAFAERVNLVKGRLDPEISSAMDLCWFFWEKHRRVRRPHPIQLRIPPGTRARLTRPSDAAFAMDMAA